MVTIGGSFGPALECERRVLDFRFDKGVGGRVGVVNVDVVASGPYDVPEQVVVALAVPLEVNDFGNDLVVAVVVQGVPLGLLCRVANVDSLDLNGTLLLQFHDSGGNQFVLVAAPCLGLGWVRRC